MYRGIKLAIAFATTLTATTALAANVENNPGKIVKGLIENNTPYRDKTTGLSFDRKSGKVVYTARDNKDYCDLSDKRREKVRELISDVLESEQEGGWGARVKRERKRVELKKERSRTQS